MLRQHMPLRNSEGPRPVHNTGQDEPRQLTS